ncbi:MAG: sensor histidine kinase [Pseudomonadota bacterium]
MAERTTIAGVRAWRPLLAPAQRWPLSTDLLIAVLSLTLTLLMWARQGMAMTSFTDVGTFVCAFVGNLALLWRRSHPLCTHYVVLAACVLVQLGSMSGGVFALTFSLYSVGRHAKESQDSMIAMAAAVLFVAADAFVISSASIGGTLAVIMAVALWYAGRRYRFRGEYLRLLEERAEHLERERSVDAERAVTAERTRIAREMHDIVAHQLSLMTVQAGAAKTVSKSDPEAAREAMAAVEKAGRQAVCEMRHLLGVLRPVSEEENGLDPQPGVGDLPALVREVGDVGPAVALTMDPTASALPARLQLTAYRIVQEALTNVIRHAGEGVAVDVAITRLEGMLLVAVRDDGRGGDITESSGHGLRGMRERVELIGGRFDAGRLANGGFQVRAELPVEPGAS